MFTRILSKTKPNQIGKAFCTRGQTLEATSKLDKFIVRYVIGGLVTGSFFTLTNFASCFKDGFGSRKISCFPAENPAGIEMVAAFALCAIKGYVQGILFPFITLMTVHRGFYSIKHNDINYILPPFVFCAQDKIGEYCIYPPHKVT